MGFDKIKSLSLTDLFVEQLQNMIFSGELVAGSQLPPTRELSAKMGVSRPVITAGLIELEKMGFIEIIPRKGAFVCDYRRKGTIETLVSIMRYNGGLLPKKETKSLFEIRDVLEALCMELIIDTATDEELDEIAPLLENIENAASPKACAEAVFNFHHELAVLSGNVLLPLLYHSFKVESIYLWEHFIKRKGINAIYTIKLELYKALLNRDKATATKTPGEYPNKEWPFN